MRNELAPLYSQAKPQDVAFTDVADVLASQQDRAGRADGRSVANVGRKSLTFATRECRFVFLIPSSDTLRFAQP